jgi:maltose alpha-D-glucosyltransferase/alpha-amylase
MLALARQDPEPIIEALRETPKLPAGGQWATFLRNHDEVDLSRLTADQRAQAFEVFGPEPEMQLYGRGIRRRLAPMLGGDRRRMELAYSLMFTLPGTPVLRYGDELGMGDDLGLPERVGARTPMQWSTEPQGGFTTSDKPVVPVISEGPYGYQHVNAAVQRRDPNSMLNWTERIVRMRKEVPEIGWGEYEVLPVRDPAILAVRYDWRNNSVLFVHNLSDTPREVALSTGLAGPEGRVLINLLTENHSNAAEDGKHHVLLEAYAYRWYRVGGLDYLLKRSDIETPART